LKCQQCGRPAIVQTESGLSLCLYCYDLLQKVIERQNRMLAEHKYRLLQEMEMTAGMPGLFTSHISPPSPPPPVLNLRISDNVAGMINLGVINNLNSALEFVGKQEAGDLAGALRTFAQVVLENAELKDQEKKELIEQVSALAAEAGKPPTQRQVGLLRALVDRIRSTAVTIAALNEAWQAVEPWVTKLLSNQ